jgi:RNA polymerase sigma-70 factor (ECF subfamily)
MVAQANERKFGETPQELIAACQRGEHEAFETLFTAHKDRVFSIALRFAGDRTAAMDITQDTFLKLLRQIQAFRGDSRFETWLYRLVVNACLDYQRSRRRWRPLIEDFVHKVRGGFEVARTAERGQVCSRVQSEVAKLAADQRVAVVLRYTEGLSYEEIAAVTGCPVGTVASRLNRAHKVLEGRLQDFKGDCA